MNEKNPMGRDEAVRVLSRLLDRYVQVGVVDADELLSAQHALDVLSLATLRDGRGEDAILRSIEDAMLTGTGILRIEHVPVASVSFTTPAPASQQEKPHVRVGTIGHVDHGKRTLTAALTKIGQMQASQPPSQSPTDSSGIGSSQEGEISEARVEAALAVLGLRADRKDDVRAALRVAGVAPPAADKVRELIAGLPRAVELAERLTMPGGKAAHVSASELHEVADFIDAVQTALSEQPAQRGEGES